jgi:hypothetical protein
VSKSTTMEDFETAYRDEIDLVVSKINETVAEGNAKSLRRKLRRKSAVTSKDASNG